MRFLQKIYLILEALLNAPPKKVSNKPNIPLALCCNLEGSIPGNTTNEPNLKMIKNPTVVKIRDFNSSIEKIFLITENNLFID